MQRSFPARALLSLIVVTALAGPANAQQSPEQTVAGLKVPGDWEVTLYASEPLITNPTAIDIDAHGRVWVCEGQWYRGRAKTPPADCVKVLEDVDGDGRAEKATVFADGLLVPMSVAVAGTRVYVGESPNLWVYEDRDGDLRADPGSKKALLSGFGGHNSDHGIHGLVLGPDHRLYMTIGDTGFDVTGPDGAHAGYRWGAILRCELDGSKFASVALNFRNPYELASDSFGNIWCVDNDSDGNKGVRVSWVLEGGNYGWYGSLLDFRSPDGSYDPVHHWREPIPGHVPAALLTGFGSPAGLAFYEHDLFGERLAGCLLHAEAGPREIRTFTPARSGAGFSARQDVIMTGHDDYFRPVDVCVAPDGSIYVADWYDEGVGGHAYNNPRQGRIYRIAPKGAPRKPRNPFAPFTDATQARSALASPNLATQFDARAFLLTSGGQAAELLTKSARTDEPHLAARALWVLDRLGARNEIEKALSDTRAGFRALAVRILRQRDPRPLDRILPLAGDADPQVRREVLLALRPAGERSGASWSQTPEAERTALLELLRSWDGRDRFYLEAIGVAAGGRGPELFEALGLNTTDRLTLRTIRLLQILNPPGGLQVLISHLDASELAPEVADGVVDALGWRTEPEAMKAVASAMARQNLPMSARRLALQRIRGRIRSDYRKLAEMPELTSALRAVLGEPALRLEALELIGHAQLQALDEAVVKILHAAPDRTTRQAAIGALGELNTPAARGELLRAVTQSTGQAQEGLIRILAGMRAFESLEKLLTDDALPGPSKAAAIGSIGRFADGCLFLLTLIEDGKLNGALRQEAIRIGGRHADINVRQLYAKFVPAASQPATIAELDPRRVLALTGDADRGRELFAQSAAKCNTCHRVGAEGTDIGPDLTLIGRKYAPEAMLEHIMRPGAAVAPEFVPYVVESDSQGYVLGFLLGRTDQEIELKTQNGQRLTLPAPDVTSIQKQEGTIMPDLLLESFREQDVADLLAYMNSLTVVPQPVRAWLVAGPFPAREFHLGFETIYDPEKELNPRARYAQPDGGTVTWQPYAPPFVGNQYVVELEKLTAAGAKPAVTYLYARLDSPRDQPASISLESEAAVKVFLNQTLVFSRHRHPVRDAGFSLRLASGSNDLLLKLEHQGGEGRLALLITSAEPLTIRTSQE